MHGRNKGRKMNERREDKPHINKEFNPYNFIQILILAAGSVASVILWANEIHAQTDREIAVTNKQVAINRSKIEAAEKSNERERRTQERFYKIIEDKVTSIERLMIKKDDKLNRLIEKMAVVNDD